MPVKLNDKLVLGLSSRALFDLAEANAVFELQGLTAYREYQRKHEREVLAPGTAYPLVKGLLAVNKRAGEELVEVIIFSRNDADSAMRVFNSIEAHDLPITRGVFRGGRDPFPFLSALSCDVFLTAEPSQALKANEQGVPAALIMGPPAQPAPSDDGSEVRIAFDGDAVLFGAESQRVYDAEGLDAFHAHELALADDALSPGPLAPFLRGLARIQAHFPGASPIRTALVTSRGAPAHLRVVNTLRAWGVEVDETFFLGGVDKTEVLAAFGAHIFFDDQLAHVEAASRRVPAAQVLWPIEQLEAGSGEQISVVIRPPGVSPAPPTRPIVTPAGSSAERSPAAGPPSRVKRTARTRTRSRRPSKA